MKASKLELAVKKHCKSTESWQSRNLKYTSQM